MKILTVEETSDILVHEGLDRPSGAGFALRQSREALFYDWHVHPYHQLIYARSGTTQVEDERGRHLLPTAFAIWIPAGVRHRTMICNLDGVSVYFDPDHLPDTHPHGLHTFLVPAVLREMLLYALRWTGSSCGHNATAHSFFQTLGLLSCEHLNNAPSFVLPAARLPGLVRAMDNALSKPGSATQAQALRDAGMSERSFRRRFNEETGISWQEWITQARLFQAAHFLSEGQRVTDVAAEVGYASLSAFAKAFTRLTGMTPARFRDAQKQG